MTIQLKSTDQDLSNVFINEMIISPLKMSLSLQTMSKSILQESTPFEEMIYSLGVTLVDVDKATLKLKGFKMR